MTCSITITNVSGQDVSEGRARTIFIEGMATECTDIKVDITTGCETPISSIPVDIAADGRWDVTIPGVNCPCGEVVEVKAYCPQITNNPCEAPPWRQPLECPEMMPTPGCPTVEITDPVYGDCMDGARLVTLIATITPASPTDVVVAHWDFGDGTPSTPLIPPPSLSHTPHSYGGTGPFTARLVIDRPEDCPVTEVEVQPCPPPEETRCEVNVTYDPIPDGDCVGDRTSVTVHFHVDFDPSAHGCTYVWNFGDESEIVETTASEVEHIYTRAGGFDVSVGLYDCDCRAVGSVRINIPPCCPVLESVSAGAPVGCADGDSCAAKVEFVATTNPLAAAGSFTWEFGEGMLPVTGSRTEMHSYNTPGRKDVRVTFTPTDPSCIPTSRSTSVTIMACSPGTSPCTDTPPHMPRSSCMDFICAILLAGALLFLAIAVILGFIAGCSFPNTFTPPMLYVFIGSLAALALALLFLVLWGVFCASFNCDPLIWLIRILAVLTGVAAALAIGLGVAGNPCWLGSLLSSGYLGSALAAAIAIGETSGCYGPRRGM